MSLTTTWILTCHGPASEMLSGHPPCSSANSWTESRPYRKQTSRPLGTTPPSSTKCRTSVPPESQPLLSLTGPFEHARETAPAAWIVQCPHHTGTFNREEGQTLSLFPSELKNKTKTQRITASNRSDTHTLASSGCLDGQAPPACLTDTPFPGGSWF